MRSALILPKALCTRKRYGTEGGVEKTGASSFTGHKSFHNAGIWLIADAIKRVFECNCQRKSLYLLNPKSYLFFVRNRKLVMGNQLRIKGSVIKSLENGRRQSGSNVDWRSLT